MLVVVCEEIPF